MAKDLDMQEEDVERAFKYWARDGLVRQVGDNPVRFTLANLKQLTLTQAENRGISCITKSLSGRPSASSNGRFCRRETNLINDWVQVFELPEEVDADAAQIEMENSGGRVSIKIADRRAKEWAQSGIRTVDDVEKVVVMGRASANSSSAGCWRVWVSAARAERDEKDDVQDVDRRMGLHAPRPCRKPAARRRRNADHGVSQRHPDAPAPARAAQRPSRWKRVCRASTRRAALPARYTPAWA